MVTLGDFVSSIRYNVFKEGRAIKISIKAGSTVQMVSISCPSIIYLLYFLLTAKETTRYRVRIVINVKIIMA